MTTEYRGSIAEARAWFIGATTVLATGLFFGIRWIMGIDWMPGHETPIALKAACELLFLYHALLFLCLARVRGASILLTDDRIIIKEWTGRKWSIQRRELVIVDQSIRLSFLPFTLPLPVANVYRVSDGIRGSYIWISYTDAESVRLHLEPSDTTAESRESDRQRNELLTPWPQK